MVKTIVIGLDAATWRIIDPLLEKEVLPNIQKLIKNGTRGIMKSTNPPMTPLAWTSISTGTNPGKHGIYDFLEQDRNSYKITPTDYSGMARPTIWDIFSSENKEIGVINYPLVNPPDEVTPFFISGIPAGDEGSIAFPEEVKNLLDRSDYRVHPRANSNQAEEYFGELKQVAQNRLDISIELLEKYDPELLWTVFMSTDWAQHYLWDEAIGDKDALQEFYIHIDKLIGELVQQADDGYDIVIISDHGATKIDGEIHMNSLLENWGYLRKDETKKESNTQKLKRAILGSLWKIGTKFPSSIKSKVKGKASSSLLNEIRAAANVAQLNMHTSIDWTNTTAFSYGYMGRVFIHTEEYSQGTINKGDKYEALREEILQKLESLEDPRTGKKVVEKAFKSEEVYQGERTDWAPDIVFKPRDWKYMVYGDFGDGEWIHDPKNRIADHDEDGVVIAAGENIQNRSDKIECDVTDITPTLLYLHDLPVLDGMDGSVLTQIFTDKYKQAHEVKKMPDDTIYRPDREPKAEDQEGVKDRLEDLGYL